MNCGVKLIKRGCADVLPSSARSQDKKSRRQNEREIGQTVKNWIEELAQRKRLTHLGEVQVSLTVFQVGVGNNLSNSEEAHQL